MNDEERERKERLLEDYTKDVRSYMSSLKSIVLILCSVLVLFIGAFVAIEIHNQRMMAEISKHSQDTIKEFLSEYDWEVEYEIESVNNELFSGNITVER